MPEPQQEIGYYNPSTKAVITGYSDLFHNMSKGMKECNEHGNVTYHEMVGGNPRQINLRLKGQIQLDRDRRGGERLWQRIMTQEELVKKLEAKGAVVSPPDDEFSE